MTAVSVPPFPTTMERVANAQFMVRFVTADGTTHEVECQNGALAAWRQGRTSVSMPVLELFIPRVVDDGAPFLPFTEDPYLHRDVLVASGPDGSKLQRLFPLVITGRQEPKELLGRLGMLWILRDGPFGDFAWCNVFVDGACVANDAVAESDTEGTPWDVIIEADFVDCIGHFRGDLEIRDMLARGNIQGSIAGLSALTWFVERDEMLDRAREYHEESDLLRDWVTIARSDAVLEWAAQFDRGGRGL